MPLRLGKDLRNIIAPLANDPLIPLSGFGLDATHFDSVLRSEGNGYNLFEIYQEIERDCHAFAVLQSRKLDVSRREWEIRPYQQKNASIRRKDQKTADMITDMLTNMGGGLEELDGQALVQSGETGFDTWTHAALNALLYGFSGSEIAWSGNREVYPERIIYRKPHRFKFALVPEGYLPKLRVRAQLDIPLPPRKFIFHYHQPENGPFGLGLGHRLFWPVFFKREDVKQWLLFSEKYASPTIAVSHPTNATSAEIGEALETAEAMSSQVAIAVPEEFKYELLEAQRSGSINAYQDLASWCDEQISKAVLGQTGTTDQSSGGGSRARDEVAERVSLRLAKHDADCLANTVNSTLIRWIMRFNGGQQQDLPQLWWQFPELEQQEDLTARAAIDKTLWDMEFIPTREYIEETYEIELEEEPTEELGPDGQPIPSASDQLEQLFGGGVVPAGAPAAPAEVAAPVEPEPTLSELDPLDALEYLMSPVDFAAKKKGGKKAGLKKKNCKKGKVCGGSCIAESKRCKTDPPSPAAGAAAKAFMNTDPFGPENNPLPAQPAKPTPSPKPPVQQQPDPTPAPEPVRPETQPVANTPTPSPAPKPSTPAEYTPPRREDAIRDFEELGRGGFGVVVLDRENNVAIKYSVQSGSPATSKREVEMMQIASDLGVGPKLLSSNRDAVAMEFLGNYKTFKDYRGLQDLGLEGQKTVAKNYFQQLEKLHNAGVTHGDMFGGNVMFDPDTLDVRVIDYGLSRKTNSRVGGVDFQDMREGFGAKTNDLVGDGSDGFQVLRNPEVDAVLKRGEKGLTEKDRAQFYQDLYTAIDGVTTVPTFDFGAEDDFYY